MERIFFGRIKATALVFCLLICSVFFSCTQSVDHLEIFDGAFTMEIRWVSEGHTYNAIADDPKSVLDFIKVFLEDSFIVLDISSKDYSDRVCWYVPTSLENSRIDTLMKLEIFEKYFFQRTNQE